MMGNIKKSAKQQIMYMMAIMGRHFLVIQSSSFFFSTLASFVFVIIVESLLY
jgi:hypothetical protein